MSNDATPSMLEPKFWGDGEWKSLDNGPHLVLAIEHPWVTDDPTGRFHAFKEPDLWHRIQHQTAGVFCNQRYLEARFLPPTPLIFQLMTELGRDQNLINLRATLVGLSDVVAYSERLARFGLSCERSHRAFEEAIYPIDCSLDILRKVTTWKPPTHLDDLIVWENEGNYPFHKPKRRLHCNLTGCGFVLSSAVLSCSVANPPK